MQHLADEKYRLLKDDPRHPSLQLKRVGRFGRAESAVTIARSALMSRTESCGSGSAITANMIASSANLIERYRDLGLINLVEMYR